MSKISFRTLTEAQLRVVLDYLDNVHPHLKRRIRNLDPFTAYLTGKGPLPTTTLRLENISHSEITPEDLKDQPLNVLLEYSDNSVLNHNSQKDISTALVIEPIDIRPRCSPDLPPSRQLSPCESSPPPPYKALSQDTASGNDTYPTAFAAFESVNHADSNQQIPASGIDMGSSSLDGVGNFSRLDIQSLQPSNDLTDTVLDFLLGLLNTDTVNRPDGTENWTSFHIWPSIRIQTGDETAIWSPQAHNIAFNLSRYQLLPYFANLHWQLAVFDIVKHTLDRYDCFWPGGTDQSTYTVRSSSAVVLMSD